MIGTLKIVVGVAVGVLIAAAAIYMWNAWQQDRADKAFAAACLAKDTKDVAERLWALGARSDADLYRCVELRRIYNVH